MYNFNSLTKFHRNEKKNQNKLSEKVAENNFFKKFTQLLSESMWYLQNESAYWTIADELRNSLSPWVIFSASAKTATNQLMCGVCVWVCGVRWLRCTHWQSMLANEGEHTVGDRERVSERWEYVMSKIGIFTSFLCFIVWNRVARIAFMLLCVFIRCIKLNRNKIV